MCHNVLYPLLLDTAPPLFIAQHLSLLRPATQAEYCDERVCLSVCLSVRDIIFGSTRPIFTKFFVLVTYGHGSVTFWRRCDRLLTSGFIFGHKPKLLDVATQLKRSAPAALAINCAQAAGQRTHGPPEEDRCIYRVRVIYLYFTKSW